METNIINYSYKGSEISFTYGENVMLNATQMAKPFKKRTNDYLVLPSTNELVKAITRKSSISENQLVTTRQGSPDNGGGTWMHEDLALDFAQWLSVDFKLWCNDRIKELLKTGVATISDDDATIANAMAILQKRLDTINQEKNLLQTQTDLQREQLQIAAPKVNYYDNVMNSESTYGVNLIAKELGFSAESLNKLLKEKGVQYKQIGRAHV